MNRSRHILIFLVMILSTTLAFGCSGQTGERGGGGTGGYGGDGSQIETGAVKEKLGSTVIERNNTFRPSTITVQVGDTVTFTNADTSPHEVEIDGERLGEQAQGQSVKWKAEKAGDFPYKCTIHPQMAGEVIVE